MSFPKVTGLPERISSKFHCKESQHCVSAKSDTELNWWLHPSVQQGCTYKSGAVGKVLFDICHDHISFNEEQIAPTCERLRVISLVPVMWLVWNVAYLSLGDDPSLLFSHWSATLFFAENRSCFRFHKRILRKQWTSFFQTRRTTIG